MALDPNTIIELQHNLDKLKREHALMEEKIHALLSSTNKDDLKIHRLKREKLALKDQIAKIDGLLTPNIIA
jgi:hypothetical protein